MVALLTDIVVVDGGQVQGLHPTPDQVRDLGPLDLLGVVVPGLVGQINGILEGREVTIALHLQ